MYLGDPGFNGFDNKAIRSAFITKVYSILLVQLIATSILIAVFTFHQPTKVYFQQNGTWYLYGALILGMAVFFILVCIDSTRRSFPLNFILLSLLTLGYGLMAAVLSSRYDTITVLLAFGSTALATFIVILLAKFSPFDMTTCGCGLCVLGLIHLVASLLLIAFVPVAYANTTALIIAGFGAFLVSLYLMFDLQLIMGGRQVELSPEEYILGAVILYIDIINLFQYMLLIFGSQE